MTEFSRASLHLVPAILEILKNDAPSSTVACQMLETYSKCKNVVSDLDVRLYTPGGKLDKHGTFFLYIPEHRGNMVFYTLDKDTDLFKKRLMDIPDIDWSLVVLAAVTDRFHCMVMEFVKEKNLGYNEPPKPSDNLAITREAALNIPIIVPDDMELRPAIVEDAEFIDDQWPRKRPKTLRYVLDAIKANGGYVLWKKETKERVAWCLHNMIGSVGMIQTADEHKRKGYGEIVGKAVTKMIAEKGIEPQVQIKHGNTTSKRLFTRIGFQDTHVLQWYCITDQQRAGSL